MSKAITLNPDTIRALQDKLYWLANLPPGTLWTERHAVAAVALYTFFSQETCDHAEKTEKECLLCGKEYE